MSITRIFALCPSRRRGWFISAKAIGGDKTTLQLGCIRQKGNILEIKPVVVFGAVFPLTRLRQSVLALQNVRASIFLGSLNKSLDK